MLERMNILAIETSCDETAVALLSCTGSAGEARCEVLAHQLYSQIAQHRSYGGVYPNLAKRLHSQNLVPLLRETLKSSGMLQVAREQKNYTAILQNCSIVLEREPELYEGLAAFIPTIEQPSIDAIAVTQGPGLEPALWVGINFARALSLLWSVPVIPVNHMEGHIASVLYQNRSENRKLKTQKVAFPALTLLISGGHTQLVLARAWGRYELLGETRDDAVGEAFDKVARILTLSYPGGPEISRLAERARRTERNPFKNYTAILQNCSIVLRKVFRKLGTPDTASSTGRLNRYQSSKRAAAQVDLPRPMINSPDYDFSFSGLKTAVLYHVRALGTVSDHAKQEIAREFEDAVSDVLVTKTKRALKAYAPKTLIVAGGVIANEHLRRNFVALARDFPAVTLRIPHHDVTGDNAIMIGIAGYLRALTQKEAAQVEGLDLRANGNLQLGT